MPVRKGFKGMSFVSEWLTYSQDRRIVTDDDDIVSRRCRPPEYRHNRHDQTVLSLLGKKWGIPFRPRFTQKTNYSHPAGSFILLASTVV